MAIIVVIDVLAAPAILSKADIWAREKINKYRVTWLNYLFRYFRRHSESLWKIWYIRSSLKKFWL